MTEDEINHIEKLCNEAANGPWVSCIEGRDHTSGSNFIMTGTDSDRGSDIELSGATDADQDFIAACRQAVPALIHEIRRLRSLLLRQ